MRVAVHLSLLLVLLNCCGCLLLFVPHRVRPVEDGRHPITAEQREFLRPGETDFAEVLLRMGEPDFWMEQERTLVYTWATSTLWYAVAFGPGGSSGEVPVFQFLAVEFDANGFVVRWAQRRGADVDGIELPESVSEQWEDQGMLLDMHSPTDFLDSIFASQINSAAQPGKLAPPIPAIPPRYSEATLSFLQDRVTTRQEVIEKLRAPTGEFEDARILTYRLNGHRKDGYFSVARDPPPSADRVDSHLETGHRILNRGKFCLVLAFDGDTLARHSLVRLY